MTVWITGANGFIGRHLIRELADSGKPVHGLGHGTFAESDRRALGLQSWLNGEIDAANLNALAAVQGLPSKVFHLAGGASVGLSIELPLEDFLRTVASTARLLEWLRNCAPKCLLVVASSAAVYLIVRLFSVYGRNLRKQLLWDVCSRLSQGGPALALGGTGAEIRDWTDVRDVVRLLASLGELPPDLDYRVVNGGSGQPTRVADIAEMLVKGFGRETAVSYSGVARRGDPHSLLADDSALRRIGFEWRVPVERGIADYVRWFKGQAVG